MLWVIILVKMSSHSKKVVLITLLTLTFVVQWNNGSIIDVSVNVQLFSIIYN